MFRWLRGKKKNSDAPQQEIAPPELCGDDWDFLRAQPDHDAEVMAAVHGAEEREPNGSPAPELAPALAPPVEAAEEPGLLDLLDPEEPRRLPRRVRESVVSQAPRAPRADEHQTKPLTLLSELCAKFQDPADVRPEWERGGYTVPGWTLTLEVTVKGRVFQRVVSEEAIVGREDPATGHKPDVDLSLDDTISRRHARIYARAGRYWLRDLQSMNGTRHNQEWLQPGGEVTLSQGDEIMLGEFCRIRVVDPVMHAEEAGVRDLLQMALGGTLCADWEEQVSGQELDPADPQDSFSDLAPVSSNADSSLRGMHRP